MVPLKLLSVQFSTMNKIQFNGIQPGKRLWHWMRRPGWVIFIAVVLRIAVMGILLAHNQLSWGVNEPARIAESIVHGRGFSSAFHDASGPTAWLAPVYPMLLAGIFWFFGVETASSAFAAILLNVVFSSLTAAALIQLGREQFSESAGIVAGWGWAVAPPLLFMPWLLWETCFSGLVMTVGVMATLRLKASSRQRDWAWCAAIWSFAAWLNPAILAALAALTIDAAMYTRRLKGPVLMIFLCVLSILPWTARNYLAFGRIVPMRSNFWPEAYFGNVDFSLHPTGDAMLYQREGEIGFVNDMKMRTLRFVGSNPRAFARLVGARVVAFWMQPSQQQPYPIVLLLTASAGIVQAWRRKKRWVAFASVLLLYPLVYYLTNTFARYRHPIEPLMYALAAYFVCESIAMIAKRGRRTSMSQDGSVTANTAPGAGQARQAQPAKFGD
jgi:hypothetical protein